MAAAAEPIPQPFGIRGAKEQQAEAPKPDLTIDPVARFYEGPLRVIGITKIKPIGDLRTRPEVGALVEELEVEFARLGKERGGITGRDYFESLLRKARELDLIGNNDFLKSSAWLRIQSENDIDGMAKTALKIEQEGKGRSVALKTVTEAVNDGIKILKSEVKKKQLEAKYPPIVSLGQSKLVERMAKSDNRLVSGMAFYLRFREKDAQTQKTETLTVLSGALDYFWNDSQFMERLREKRDKAREGIAKAGARVGEAAGTALRPIKQAAEAIATPVAEKATEVREAAVGKIADVRQARRYAIAIAEKRMQHWSNINEMLSKGEGIIRGAPGGDQNVTVQLLKKFRAGARRRRDRSMVGFALNLILKSVLEPIKTVVSLATKVASPVTNFIRNTARPIAERVGPLASRAKEWASATTSKVSKFASAVWNLEKRAVALSSEMLKSIGDAALPAAVVFVVTGNPILAGATLTGTGGISLGSRLLSRPGILPARMLAQYGSLEAKGLLAYKDLTRIAKIQGVSETQLVRAFTPQQLEAFRLGEGAARGGSSLLSSSLKALKAGSTYGTLALLAYTFGIISAPVAIALAAGATASHLAISRSMERYVLNNIGKIAGFNSFIATFPSAAILNLYFGVEWIKDQLRKARELGSNYFKEEWLNLRLEGGLGNTLQLGLTVSGGVSFTRWISNTLAIRGVGGVTLAKLAGPMAAGTVAGTIIGALAAGFLGLSVGTAAIIGGVVGGVVGGAAAFIITSESGGWGVFFGSAAGSAAGTFIGSLIDSFLNKARELFADLGVFLNILSIVRFANMLASFLTSPLTKLSSLLEIVMAFIMIATTIGTIAAFSSNSSSSNTPAQASGSGSI